LSEIKTSLMSMTAIFPGSCTLLFNLLTAYADGDTATATDTSPPEATSPGVGVGTEIEGTRVGAGVGGRVIGKKTGPSFSHLFKKWRVLNSYQVGDGSEEEEGEEEDKDDDKDPPLNSSNTHHSSITTDPPRKGSLSRQQGASVPDWFSEYKSGYEWEIYLVQLGTGYRGQKYLQIVSNIYDELGVVLFALRVKDVTGLTHASVMINPYRYTIPMSRNVIIEGFIIAKDRHSANVMAHIANSFSMTGTGTGVRGGGGGTGTGGGSQSLLNQIDQKMKPPTPNSKRRENICITPTTGVRGGGGGGQERRHLKDILYPQSIGHHSILNSAFSSSSLSENQGIEYEERQLHEEKIFHELYHTTHSSLFSSAPPPAAATSTSHSPFPPSPLPPPRLEQMLITSSLLLEYPLVKNHIVLITKQTGIKYLYDFIKPLRRKYLGRCIDILILSPVRLSHEIFNTISVFQGIYWIIGSPLKVHDLRRAGIYRASQCVILADYQISSFSSSSLSSSSCSSSQRDSSSPSPSSSTSSSSTDEHTLADAESIFTYHSIKKENPTLNVLVEIIQSENVKFLETSLSMESTPHNHHNSGGEEDYDYHLSSNFANGSLFMSSIVDALVPQAFYNPHLIVIINKLLGNDTSTGTYTSSTSTYTSSTTPIHETSLVQITLPEEFHGKCYKELFHSLLNKGILSIGLYRKKLQFPHGGDDDDDKYASTNHRPRSHPIMFSYVYTNPHPDEILTKLDRVYVLTDQQLLKPHLFTSQVASSSLHPPPPPSPPHATDP
jgi:hypothetical protein